jgi:DNA-binding transcriptional LysR family regulator
MNNAASDLAPFLAVARHLSFRRAAIELGLTPSAVSHALRTLEDRLQVRLVNRTTRSVALTEAGTRLHERLQPAFRDIDDALEELNHYRGTPMGTLRLNAASASAKLVLMGYVTEFLAHHPSIRIEIVAQGAMVDVVAEGFDAGLRFGEVIAADMIAVPIGARLRSAVVATPAFFERHARPATPHDLLRLPCIRYRFDNGSDYRWEFERGGVELRIVADGPLVVNEQELMLQAALAGTGIAYVFEGMAAAEVAAGRLVRVLEDWCPYYPGIFLYYPSRRQMPAALRAFVDFVRGRPA